MKISIDNAYTIDTSIYFDLSLEIFHGKGSDRAFGIGPAEIIPYQFGEYKLEVSSGATVNCFDVRFNPHGNGTHTECLGHISPEHHSVNAIALPPFMKAILISVACNHHEGDRVIMLEDFQNALNARFGPKESLQNQYEALILRTLPNEPQKQQEHWSGNNPPYIQPEVMTYIRELGIQHFLTDLPSVDREEDGGKLLAHRAFWNVPEAPKMQSTISELLYIDSKIPDDKYILNLQTAAFRSDATPSRPLIFPLIQP